MPLDPPVMTATFPSSFPMITPLHRCVRAVRPGKCVHRASTGRAKLYSFVHSFVTLETASKGVDSFGGGRELPESPYILSIRPKQGGPIGPYNRHLQNAARDSFWSAPA